MKGILLVLIAALLMPFAALAVPDVDYSISPETPVAGQEYKIHITATDPNGIDSIKDQIKGRRWDCVGMSPCTAVFSYLPSEAGSAQYTFYAKPVGEGEGKEVTVPVTIKSASSSNTQGTPTSGETSTTSSTYNVPGSTNDANAGTLNTNLVGEAVVGKEFSIRVIGRDADGIDSIVYINSVTASPERWACEGRNPCEHTWKDTVNVAGPKVYTFRMYDTTGHVVETKTTINVGTGTATPTGTTSQPSPSGQTFASSGGSTDTGPVVSYKVTPQNPIIGDVVTFDASASHGRGSATIRSYEWDFNGDDIVDSITSSAIATYTYNQEGSYRIRLAVTDSNGMTKYADARTITVKSCCRDATNGDNLLSQFGFFTVTVMDGDQPVEGANVQLTGPSSYSTQTDALGKAYFQVQEGCYTIEASKDGKNYEQKDNVCIKPGESQPIDLNSQKLASVAGSTVPWLYILAATIIIAVVGGAVYYYMNADPTKGEQKPKVTQLHGTNPTKNN